MAAWGPWQALHACRYLQRWCLHLPSLKRRQISREEGRAEGGGLCCGSACQVEGSANQPKYGLFGL